MKATVDVMGVTHEMADKAAQIAAMATGFMYSWRPKTPKYEIDSIEQDLNGIRTARKVVRETFGKGAEHVSSRRMGKMFRRVERTLRAELRRVKGYHRRHENRLPPSDAFQRKLRACR